MLRVYGTVTDSYGVPSLGRRGHKFRALDKAKIEVHKYQSGYITSDSSGKEVPVFWHGKLDRKISGDGVRLHQSPFKPPHAAVR